MKETIDQLLSNLNKPQKLIMRFVILPIIIIVLFFNPAILKLKIIKLKLKIKVIRMKVSMFIHTLDKF
jgi:hypothetical protein